MKSNAPNTAPNRAAEYRAARDRARRQATKTVRRTLIFIAIIAGLYYLYLASTQKPNDDAPPPAQMTNGSNE